MRQRRPQVGRRRAVPVPARGEHGLGAAQQRVRLPVAVDLVGAKARRRRARLVAEGAETAAPRRRAGRPDDPGELGPRLPQPRPALGAECAGPRQARGRAAMLGGGEQLAGRRLRNLGGRAAPAAAISACAATPSAASMMPPRWVRAGTRALAARRSASSMRCAASAGRPCQSAGSAPVWPSEHASPARRPAGSRAARPALLPAASKRPRPTAVSSPAAASRSRPWPTPTRPASSAAASARVPVAALEPGDDVGHPQLQPVAAPVVPVAAARSSPAANSSPASASRPSSSKEMPQDVVRAQLHPEVGGTRGRARWPRASSRAGALGVDRRTPRRPRA